MIAEESIILMEAIEALKPCLAQRTHNYSAMRTGIFV